MSAQERLLATTLLGVACICIAAVLQNRTRKWADRFGWFGVITIFSGCVWALFDILGRPP